MRIGPAIRGVVAAALIVTAGLLAARGLLPVGGSRPVEDDDLAQPASSDEPLLCLQRGVVDRGESLFEELLAEGVCAGEAEKLLSALSEVMDMRRLKPGESFEVMTDEEGRIASFLYARGVRERITAVHGEGGFRCEVSRAPLEERLRRIEGTIKTSLWESMVGQGASPELVVKLADVFAWEIDFLTDPRKGDTYVLVAQEFCQGDNVVEYGDILAARYTGQSRSWTAIGFVGDDGVRRYYGPDGRSVKRAFLKSPLNFRRISSYFSHSRFHPVLKRYRPHLGVDYAAAKGTPVVSIGEGVVAKSGWSGGFGNYVEIRHNSVYSTCYGHLSKYGSGIRKGARVAQNQVVGYVGSTGLATGPHLDFRVKKYGQYVNPIKLDSPRADPVAGADMARFNLEAQWAAWALDYLPADYAGAAYELRTALLADAAAEGAPADLR